LLLRKLLRHQQRQRAPSRENHCPRLTPTSIISTSCRRRKSRSLSAYANYLVERYDDPVICTYELPILLEIFVEKLGKIRSTDARRCGSMAIRFCSCDAYVAGHPDGDRLWACIVIDHLCRFAS